MRGSMMLCLGLVAVKGWRTFTTTIMRHGFSESEAGKILGENWFNFLEEGLEAS